MIAIRPGADAERFVIHRGAASALGRIVETQRRPRFVCDEETAAMVTVEEYKRRTLMRVVETPGADARMVRLARLALERLP